MAAPLVADALWSRIEPLLPKHHAPDPKSGRPPVNDRAALTESLFVLKSGVPWEVLPREMPCDCGMTCWRRLRDWQGSGVWDSLLAVLLSEVQRAGKLDWSRSSVDSSSSRAVGGGEATAPNPTDRARPGAKHHLLVNGHGGPLAMIITGANVPNLQQLLPLIVRIPQVRGKRGHPNSRPTRLYADRAYDAEPARSILRWLGIEPFLAKRGTEHGSGLGHCRWVVGRTLRWLHQQRRLRVRFDRRKYIHFGFLTLAASLI